MVQRKEYRGKPSTVSDKISLLKCIEPRQETLFKESESEKRGKYFDFL